MFEPLIIHTKKSQKRIVFLAVLLVFIAGILWISAAGFLLKIVFSIFLLGVGLYLFWFETKPVQIEWKLLEDIQLITGKSKNPYKLRSCILTSWYCVWILSCESGGSKKIHLWFDQLDEQKAWQLRRNIQAWKEKSP
ncbi:hypothetical protein [Marinicellulosiphila megalodicopiae]|uniref:hypothetical protein n=1 Tax=Marinicellulosiphila megalodicopiae TaxID=2724896 RepID=UPI003BB07EC0